MAYISCVILAGVNISNPTVLAPLAGWTDSVFRRICKDFGVGLIFSEMASADALVRNRAKTFDIVAFAEQERPFGIQLFGAEPDTMAKAAELVAPFHPDIIDINFGCPAKKIVKRGAGSALMRDLDLLQQVGRAVVQATDIPVTAKLRSGWQQNVVVQACQCLESVGVQAVTVHPRSQKMQFSGQADWSIIKAVKCAVQIPVIGNGDITCAADARRMMEETGCDLVMIGRAARGNPWIFLQTNALLNDGIVLPEPTPIARLQLCLRHMEEQEEKIGRHAVFTMRKHIAFYVKGMNKSAALKQEVFAANQIQQVKDILNSYIEFFQNAESHVLEI